MAGMGPEPVRLMTALSTLRVWSWAMYDFALTVFAMNIVSRYFVLWLINAHHGADWMYSVAFAVSTGIAALLMPFAGAASDRQGQRMPFLRAATLLCVAGTAVLHWCPSAFSALIAFGIANVGCQMGGLFYDALLPTVAQQARIGWVSGLGVALGYVGAAVGLWLARGAVRQDGYGAAFLPSALLILVAALPCLCLVRDARPIAGGSSAAPRLCWRSAQRLFVGPQRQPGLLRLLVGCFFGLNAINTVIMFMAVYAKRVAGFNDLQIDVLLLLSTPFALAGALLSGWCVDRLGPRRCLIGMFILWCGAIILGVAIQNAQWMWAVGPLVGICLGGTWTTGRAFLVALSPPEHQGLLFGAYGFVGRASSNIGPLMWGQIVQARALLGPWTDRLALASLLVLCGVALVCFWRLPDVRRYAAPAAR